LGGLSCGNGEYHRGQHNTQKPVHRFYSLNWRPWSGLRCMWSGRDGERPSMFTSGCILAVH
jgi:hypothetical protein